MKRPTRQEKRDALERAAKARLARGEQDPFDEFPDGPPQGDPVAMERYLAAFRQWHDTPAGPVSAPSGTGPEPGTGWIPDLGHHQGRADELVRGARPARGDRASDELIHG